MAGASAAMLVLGSAAASAQTFTSTDTPIAIPDANAVGITSTINVGSTATIVDANVAVNINHTFVGDLNMTVTSAAGTPVRLLARPGAPPLFFGNSDNLNGVYTFDDSAAAPFPETAAGGDVPPGAYMVDATTGDSLALVNGENPNGNWTLNVNDNAGADLGTLNVWQLILTLGNIDQAYVGPTVQSIVSGGNAQVIGTLEDRKTAAFGGGRTPTADMANPYMGAQWGTWIRASTGRANAEDGIANLIVPGSAEYEADLSFIQGGFSFKFYENAESRLVGNIFGHYAHGDATVKDGAGAFRGTIINKSAGVGGSLTWLMSNGFYADLLGLGSFHDIDVTTVAAAGSTDGDTIAGSVEMGYRFNVNGLSVVPQAQLIYQNTSIDSYTDSGGTTFAFADADYLEGRFGLGFEHNYAMTMADGIFRTHGGIDVVHEFDNESSAVVNGALLGFNAEGTTLRLIGGATVVTAGNGIKFGAQGEYRAPLSNDAREFWAMSGVVGINF